MTDHKKTPRPPRNEPDIRVVMMPRDTNAEGSIFGGVILSYIDQAAYVEAKRQAPLRYVTVSMKEVVFREPVHVGDVLSLYAQATRIGRTSMTISVQVMAERFAPPPSTARVTEAEVVMVAIGDDCQPREIEIESSGGSAS
ncbi:MAG: acyl-CoA thioesterase [Planctomycetes bacterium]|nr:acyl-CoA thioesterase [Planctomycetota bacterium]